MPVEEQLTRFDELWRETSNSWPPPGFSRTSHPHKYWTIVTSLNPEAWQQVVEIISHVSRRWYWNVCYSIPQFHITVASLGLAQDWHSKGKQLQSALETIISRQQPIEIDLQGLNILRNTIVVQAIDRQDKLKEFVDRLNKGLQSANVTHNLDLGIHNQLWWASIVRLYQPIPNELFSFVSSFRRQLFASASISSLELVETNKILDPEQTKVLSSYQLSGK